MAELDGIDYLFVAPSSSVHRIQEAQTTIYHVLWELTAAALRTASAAGAPVRGDGPGLTP
jgi:D-sedoheptulose 7-phosphate isomerase